MLPSAPGVAVITQLVRQYHGGGEHGGAIQHPIDGVDLLGNGLHDGGGGCLRERVRSRSVRARNRHRPGDSTFQRNKDLVAIGSARGGRAIRIGRVDLAGDVDRHAALFSESSRQEYVADPIVTQWLYAALPCHHMA